MFSVVYPLINTSKPLWYVLTRDVHPKMVRHLPHCTYMHSTIYIWVKIWGYMLLKGHFIMYFNDLKRLYFSTSFIYHP